MKTALSYGLSIFLILICHSAFSIPMDSLYMGEVPVHSQSAEERNKAMPAALAQVFVKVSGDSQILARPLIKQRLNKSSSLVQQFSYSASGTTYLLTIHFDVNAVNQCLRDATATPNAIQKNIALKITGIHHQSDFMQLMRYLNHLTPVTKVSISSIHGNNVLVHLSLRSTEESFLKTLSVDQRLSRNPKQHTSPMIFTWNPHHE